VQVPAATMLQSPERLIFLPTDDLESDDFPLWEVVWNLNTLAPEAPLADKIRLARRAVSLLVGQYQLWRGEWPRGPLAPLTESDSRVLAEEDGPWHDPENATLLVWLRQA
jgi:hypothetical protein